MWHDANVYHSVDKRNTTKPVEHVSQRVSETGTLTSCARAAPDSGLFLHSVFRATLACVWRHKACSSTTLLSRGLAVILLLNESSASML